VTFQGRRREDTPLDRLPEDLQHGDYWRVLTTNGEYMTSESPTNLTGQVWMCWFEGELFGTLSNHTVREHEDGTASIRPGDGSSNSVLIRGMGGEFHGYLEHGVWSTV
jgi:hypothetical protein